MDMFYGLMGVLHARIYSAVRGEDGQGTVEYVAMMFVVGVIFAAVAAKADDLGIQDHISKGIAGAIDKVSGKSTGK